MILCLFNSVGNPGTVVDTGSGLLAKRCGVRIPAAARDFSVLQVVQTGSVVHPPSHSRGAGGSFPRDKATGTWKLTTDVCLVLSFRMSGDIYLYSRYTYAFMA
jgi:hypothetical protein